MAYDCGGALCTDASDFDSNGYYTGGSGSGSFDWGGFADSIVNIIPGVLSGSAALYNATHNQQGQPLPYGAPGTIGYGYPPATTQQNTWLYVGGAVFALILVIALVFLFTRKS